jgi:hypothetical protein
MAMNLNISISVISKPNADIPLLAATKKLKLAAHATEGIRAGITAAQGGFFCYFSYPSRKVKE